MPRWLLWILATSSLGRADSMEGKFFNRLSEWFSLCTGKMTATPWRFLRVSLCEADGKVVVLSARAALQPSWSSSCWRYARCGLASADWEPVRHVVFDTYQQCLASAR